MKTVKIIKIHPHFFERYSFIVTALVCSISTHQTSLSKQQLDSCLAGSSPTGWADLVEDLGDGRVVPRGHSVLAQRFLNELQHCVLRRQNTSSLPSLSADVTIQMP